MKFTCEKSLLVNGLSVASRTVLPKSPIPALEGIYVRAGMFLYLSGYNLETGITVTIPAEIEAYGSCVMPAKLFFDIIRKLPEGEVSVSVDEEFKVQIRAGITSFTFTAMTAEDYPELPDVEYENAIKLPQRELKAMISGTIFSTSEDKARRAVFTGCMIEVQNDSITMVAVDGYRLSMRRYFPKEPTERTVKFIAPASALREVEKILDDSDEMASFTLGTKHILFETKGVTLVCRILEGEFGEWRDYLPKNSSVFLTANRAQLMATIDRVGLIISEKVKSPVRCKFKDCYGEFSIISTVGEAHDACVLEGDGGEMEIGFNCRYLLDAIKAVPTEDVLLELTNGLSPIVLSPCDRSGKFAYMVLPVRLKAD